MRDGTLTITSAVAGERHGYPQYEAVYTPHRPMNIVGARYGDFVPGQPELVRGHLEFYIEEFRSGAEAELDQVLAAPTPQGQLVIIDGHHRLAAAAITGRSVKLLIDLETEPAEADNWSGVTVIEE